MLKMQPDSEENVAYRQYGRQTFISCDLNLASFAEGFEGSYALCGSITIWVRVRNFHKRLASFGAFSLCMQRRKSPSHLERKSIFRSIGPCIWSQISLSGVLDIGLTQIWVKSFLLISQSLHYSDITLLQHFQMARTVFSRSFSLVLRRSP